MSRSGADMQASENTSKFIQQRITNVEKHFGDLCQGLGNYLRRLSKVRDAGDDLAKYMMTYAEKETFNSSTKDSLMKFAAHFAAVQDYEDSEIQRLDNKVLGPLTVYGTECKHAKEKLKQAFAARNKEIKEAKNLNKAKANPRNQQGLSQAESELQKASVDATRASKQLENEMDAFERRKLDDIKRIFLDFVNIKMLFHARALEMYTQCYQSINHMSEDTDLEEFRNSLRPPSSQGRLDPTAPHAGSRTSLNTTGVSSAAMVPSAGRSTPSTTPANVRRRQLQPETPTDTLNTTNRTSMYSETQDDDYDDEDEDEDYDDEDEEDDSENDTYAQRFHRK